MSYSMESLQVSSVCGAETLVRAQPVFDPPSPSRHSQICLTQPTSKQAKHFRYPKRFNTPSLPLKNIMCCDAMCCDDLSSCLCGAMCCYCCMGGAESDNRSRRRDHHHGRHHQPVYVQPVVVSTYPVNGKAHRGGHQPNGYYVQTYRR